MENDNLNIGVNIIPKGVDLTVREMEKLKKIFLSTFKDAKIGSLEYVQAGKLVVELSDRIGVSMQNVAGANTRMKDSYFRTGEALRSMEAQMRKTNPAMISFNQIIQDAPFGLRGMGNNIQFLVQQFTVLRSQGMTTGSILQGMMKNALTPMGGLMLATSVITSGLTYFLDNFGGSAKKQKKEVEDLTGQIVELERELGKITDAQYFAYLSGQVADLAEAYRDGVEPATNYWEQTKNVAEWLFANPIGRFLKDSAIGLVQFSEAAAKGFETMGIAMGRPVVMGTFDPEEQAKQLKASLEAEAKAKAEAKKKDRETERAETDRQSSFKEYISKSKELHDIGELTTAEYRDRLDTQKYFVRNAEDELVIKKALFDLDKKLNASTEKRRADINKAAQDDASRSAKNFEDTLRQEEAAKRLLLESLKHEFEMGRLSASDFKLKLVVMSFLADSLEERIELENEAVRVGNAQTKVDEEALSIEHQHLKVKFENAELTEDALITDLEILKAKYELIGALDKVADLEVEIARLRGKIAKRDAKENKAHLKDMLQDYNSMFFDPLKAGFKQLATEIRVGLFGSLDDLKDKFGAVGAAIIESLIAVIAKLLETVMIAGILTLITSGGSSALKFGDVFGSILTGRNPFTPKENLNGGFISEPVFGVGKSGRTYTFAEDGKPEYVLSNSAINNMSRGGGGGVQTVRVVGETKIMNDHILVSYRNANSRDIRRNA